MKITIQGQDYSASLDAIRPLTIERKLNEPTVCEFWLSLPSDGSLAIPSRNQVVAVTGDGSTLYFTGYLASCPLPEYAGMSAAGPRYRLAVRAVSDELLMDQLPLSPSKGAAGMTAAALLTSQIMHTRSATLSLQGPILSAPISDFLAEAGASWSRTAGQIASQARAAYRVLEGAVTLSEIPVAVHSLSETNGTLSPSNLSLSSNAARALANDVTVCGEHEPAAYITEYFVGDGATTVFNLGADPYFPPSSRAKMIDEQFNEGTTDRTLWDNSGGTGYLALGSGGLAMNGGNGIDGETMLSWIDSVELGGTLLLEAAGVTLSAGSTGVLAGLLTGLNTLSGCIAGFQAQAQPGTGAVSLQPVVQGTPTGMTYAVNPVNEYTLRIRIYCPEIERTLAVYRSYGDSGAVAYGGQRVDAPGKLHFEIQEFVSGVAGMPVTLYDGSATNLPSACTVAAASSLNLVGTMRALRLTGLGSGWVVSTPSNGTAYTRRQGTVAEGGECCLERTGRVVFYNGFAPLAGEQIAVSYRAVGRAVGRAVNANNQQELASAGLPPIAKWIGSITSPPARSSNDCRNAASAIVSVSASTSALWRGTYRATGNTLPGDVWPGDALQIDAPSINLNTQMVVRAVGLSYTPSYPDLLTYTVAFANDWADDLAIKTSSSVPADAWLPAPIAATMLANLTRLTVAALTGTTVTINTGTAPPSGGGFEIRRRDFSFMAGEDSDLVTRGTQQTMTFSRTSSSEHFFVRMYDGATPPNYSEFSAALFINLPVVSD